VVDYRDAAGVRRWVTCQTRKDAESILERALGEFRERTLPSVDPRIRLAAYAQEHWIPIVRTAAKPRTVETYQGALDRHIVPELGAVRLSRLQRAHVKRFVARKLQQDALSPAYVKLIIAVLGALLAAARDDGIPVRADATARLGRIFKLAKSTAARQEDVKAFDRAQLAGFLAIADRIMPRLAPLFLVMARTGLRLGEALALQWEDIDLATRTLHVRRILSAGTIGKPKSGAGRDVDLSQHLVDRLTRLRATRSTTALRQGLGEIPPWIFCTRTEQPFHPRVVQRACAAVLSEAGLPGHFTPHCFRHTFASLLLSDGVSPAYVQRMLGHSSIKLTVDLYGKWLPMANKAAVDRLDEPAGREMVADGVANGPEWAPVGSRRSTFSRGCAGRRRRQPPKSFLSDSRKPPTSGPCSSPDETRWYSSRSSRCREVSFRGTSTTTL
jgi:integrase